MEIIDKFTFTLLPRQVVFGFFLLINLALVIAHANVLLKYTNTATMTCLFGVQIAGLMLQDPAQADAAPRPARSYKLRSMSGRRSLAEAAFATQKHATLAAFNSESSMTKRAGTMR
ncbi:MAG: hypothetical protein AB3N11_03045 [Arenibacterium sp.]